MKSLIGEIKECGNIILVIDEVHNLVGAGDAEGSMNAANILKPALSRGEFRSSARRPSPSTVSILKKDAALERRFQPVTVAEPTIAEGKPYHAGHCQILCRVPRGGDFPEIARQCVVLPSATSPTGSCRIRLSTCWTKPVPT